MPKLPLRGLHGGGDEGARNRRRGRARTPTSRCPGSEAPAGEDRPPTGGACEAPGGGAQDRTPTAGARGPGSDEDRRQGRLGGSLRPASAEVLSTRSGGPGGRGTGARCERDAQVAAGGADQDDRQGFLPEGPSHARWALDARKRSRMAEIQAPADYFDEAPTVGRYLDAISRWHTSRRIEETQFLSRVWFRGNPKLYPDPLRPGVYRDSFTGRAKRTYGGDDEEKRLNLERQMLEEFRVSGAAFFDANRIIDVY